MTEDINVRRRRAQFRAEHRGTKEMDWMLGRFATDKLDTMDEPQLAVFETLLTVSDPEIQDWLMTPANCKEPRYSGLIDEIRRFNNLA